MALHCNHHPKGLSHSSDQHPSYFGQWVFEGQSYRYFIFFGDICTAALKIWSFRISSELEDVEKNPATSHVTCCLTKGMQNIPV